MKVGSLYRAQRARIESCPSEDREYQYWRKRYNKDKGSIPKEPSPVPMKERLKGVALGVLAAAVVWACCEGNKED